ncbi:hypothetical protein HDU91_003351 [Kappamyces sp. JEL0680]|nr:hypothetical protein HDU91_003351 [Kappamyces sp. JEL0680]
MSNVQESAAHPAHDSAADGASSPPPEADAKSIEPAASEGDSPGEVQQPQATADDAQSAISSGSQKEQTPTSLEEPENQVQPQAPTQLPVVPPFHGSDAMVQLSSLYYALDTKFYYCGFVYKMNALSAEGKPLFKNASRESMAENGVFWSKWWMEVWGPVLHLWKVPDELASFPYTASLPIDQFIKIESDPPLELMAAIKSHQDGPILINFADSVVELFSPAFRSPTLPENPSPPLPYTSYFCLNTSASNLYVFACASTIQANHWVCAIRLAMFELQRLNLLFTNRLLRVPKMMLSWRSFQLEPFASEMFRGDIQYEGALQVRLPYTNIWIEYHGIVTSKTGPEALSLFKSGSKLFGKKDSSVADPSKRGTILFFESKKAAQKGKMPVFIMEDVRNVYAIWPSNARHEDDVLGVNLVKIEGKLQLPDTPAHIGHRPRSFSTFENGVPQIKGVEQIESLIAGLDSRPEPMDLLVIAPSTSSLTKWIVATLSAFSMPSSGANLEEEIQEMTRVESPLSDDAKPLKPIWPTTLYLSVNEVGGVTMPQHSYFETQIQLDHYLGQKVLMSTQHQLDRWNQEVSKGEWERGFCDRKEMETKLKILFSWLEKMTVGLRSHNIEVKKPHPAVLVSAMSTIVAWLGPVLNSMIGPESIPSPSKSEPKSPVPAETSAAKEKSDSSDGEGSVSEEERSSEGSQSEEDSVASGELLSSKKSLSLLDGDSSQGDELGSPKSEVFEVYAPNSLLAHAAPKKPVVSGVGPFFSTAPNPKHANPFINNSLLSKKEKEALLEDSMGEQRHSNLARVLPGPLLGSIADPSIKPIIQGGLLGEMDRKEREKKSGAKTAGINTSEPDPQLDQLVPQLNIVVSRMMLLLQNPNSESNPATFDILRADVSQISKLLNQYQMQRGLDRMSMMIPEQNRLSINPFMVPAMSWNKTSVSIASDTASSPIFKKNATDVSSSISSNMHSSSYSSSPKEKNSGTESDDEDESEEGSTEDDLPIAMQAPSVKSGTTASSRGGKTTNSTTNSTTTSGDEESESSSSSNDVPLGVLRPGSVSQFPAQSMTGAPPYLATAPNMPPQSLATMHPPFVPAHAQQYHVRAPARPAPKKPKARKSFTDSSEGSLSDESD